MYKYADSTSSTTAGPRAQDAGIPGKTTLVQKMAYAQANAAAPTAGNRPMLRVGSTGPAVAELQQKLGVAADGQFGPKTHAAVIAFQQSSGLGADGVVGPMTWSALDGAAPAATPGSPGTGAPAAAPGGAAPAPSAPGNTAAPTGPASAPAQSGDHALGGGGGPATGEPAPTAAPITSGGGVRDAIVAAARGKIGSVFSDVAAAADETGDRTRQGWEIFNVAFPSFPKQIIKYIKYGKNNGKEGSNPNGLVSWCGIFATWAVMTGGGNCGTWDGGPRCSAMNKITRDPKPGDVGYFTANSHHCIIASVNGDQIETIDGNSYDGSSGGNGAITSRMRSRGDFTAFFKQLDD